jgi:hypothetical protein
VEDWGRDGRVGSSSITSKYSSTSMELILKERVQSIVGSRSAPSWVCSVSKVELEGPQSGEVIVMVGDREAEKASPAPLEGVKSLESSFLRERVR